MVDRQIAVLIPTFNGEWCIGRALESIVTSQDVTCISAVYLADDCSFDRTIEVAHRAWSSRIPLRVLRGDRNLGEGANVNRAMLSLEKEDVEWAMLLHQDDILISPWLDHVSRIIGMTSEDVGLICCQNRYGFTDQDMQPVREPPTENINTRTENTEKSGYQKHVGGETSVRNLRKRWFLNVSGTVFRVRSYNAAGGFHPVLPFAGDVDFLCRFFLSGYSALESERVCVLKLCHFESQTARARRNATDVAAFCYLMHQYLPYSSKVDRTREYAGLLRSMSRRVVQVATNGNWAQLPGQVRGLSCATQSYAALLFDARWLIPAAIKSYLDQTPKVER